MKWNLTAILLLALSFWACDKDDGNYTNIKGLERLVYLEIKEFREANGHDGPFVLQFIMVEEAQLYSFKMAHGDPLDTEGLTDHWATIDEKLGGSNTQALVLKTPSDNEDDIFQELSALPGASEIMLEDVTQCGVGIEADSAGMNYVTVLFMKAE